MNARNDELLDKVKEDTEEFKKRAGESRKEMNRRKMLRLRHHLLQQIRTSHLGLETKHYLELTEIMKSSRKLVLSNFRHGCMVLQRVNSSNWKWKIAHVLEKKIMLNSTRPEQLF
jgi:hypothetical protein